LTQEDIQKKNALRKKDREVLNKEEVPNLVMQIFVTLVSIFYFCVSVFTVLMWLQLVHGSFFLFYLKGVHIQWAASFSLFAGLIGIVSSLLMFYYSVQPVGMKRSPNGQERLHVILMLFLTGFMLTVIALIYTHSISLLFRQREDVIKYMGVPVGRRLKFPNQFQYLLLQSLTSDHYEDFGREDNNRFWDTVQFQLGCCGINTVQDWKNSKYAIRTSKPYPLSCCTQMNDFYEDTTDFVYMSYERSDFGYEERVTESLNQTCYSQQRLVNYTGCGWKIEDFYRYLITMFLVLNISSFLLLSMLLLMCPWA